MLSSITFSTQLLQCLLNVPTYIFERKRTEGYILAKAYRTTYHLLRALFFRMIDEAFTESYGGAIYVAQFTIHLIPF